MLTIMTLNLNYDNPRHGPWPERRALILAAIREADADVVALQAVRRDATDPDALDQASQLAGLLSGGAYRYVYFQTAGGCDGSAFLSRVPFAETDCLALSLRPGLEDTNQRVLLRARFPGLAGRQPRTAGAPDGALQLFNAHYSWVLPQARDNLAESMLYMKTFAGPALLVGDMNTLPNSDLWEPLQAAGWQDVWALLRPDEPGFTYESDRPYMRIDYAWASPELVPHIRDIQVVTGPQGEDVRLSDHFGLVVRL